MRFFPQSYNGFQFQSPRVASEFDDYDWDIGGISTNNTARANNRPKYSGVIYGGDVKVVHVTLTDPDKDRDNLVIAMDVSGEEQHELYSLDELGRLWYVLAKCTGLTVEETDGKTAQYGYVFDVDDPAWIMVNEALDEWNPSANGELHTITITGNQPTNPVFEFTPGAPAGYYPYTIYIKNYNPVALAQVDGIDITNGGLDTAALIKDMSVSNQINVGGGINDSVTDWAIDTAVGGGLPAGGGVFCVGSEQCSYTSITGGNHVNGVVRGINGTTAASHGDNAVMAISRIKANGDDIRVILDGAEIPRWFGGTGLNTTTTNIFIRAAWLPGQAVALRTALDGATTPAKIEWVRSAVTQTALKAMPLNGVVRVGNEEIAYTNLNSTLCEADIVTRTARGTSIAAHAVNVLCWWVEHDIRIIYGNTTAETPVYDDDYKPVFELDSSTMTSRVYEVFADADGLRAGALTPQVIYDGLGKLNRIYTDVQAAIPPEDPAKAMGMEIAAYQEQGKIKPESAELAWQYYHAATIESVTPTGFKYKSFSGTLWPVRAALEILYGQFVTTITGTAKKKRKVTNWVTNWVALWNEAAPASANTWTALTNDSTPVVFPANIRNFRFHFSGSINALLDNFVRFEIRTLTIALKSTEVIQVGMSAVSTNYQFTIQIRNNRTGQSLFVDYPAAQAETLVVDSESMKATYRGMNAIRGISWDTIRTNWLAFEPGENELEYIADPPGDVQIITRIHSRAL